MKAGEHFPMGALPVAVQKSSVASESSHRFEVKLGKLVVVMVKAHKNI